MTTPNPITPPPELVQQWLAEPVPSDFNFQVFRVTAAQLRHLATRAAQWGADQELEACCEWLCTGYAGIAEQLRAARRPKPPSLKEQGLQALGRFNTNAHTTAGEMTADFDTIRRALEALPDD